VLFRSTVKDRRIFSDEGEPRAEEPAAKPEPQTGPQPEPAAGPQAAGQQQAPHHHLPPVDFSAFVLSLAHAAMMHLGYIPDPQTGESAPDLELARHTIDTIGMLKDKTAGNLTQDEAKLVESALSELRMAFVRASA
jgi:hypothetical protein